MASFYIGAGVLTDYRTILKKFEEYENTFDEFLRLCQELKFFYIYYGHSNLTEKVEFTEEAIRIAKDLWLELVLFPKKVNCFFLLAAMYIHQPREIVHSMGSVKIRLTDCELTALYEFLLSARAQHLEEVSNVFQILYSQGAFVICFSHKLHGLERSFLRYFSYNSEQTNTNIESFFDLLSQDGGSLDAVSATLKDYCNLKKEYLKAGSSNDDTFASEISLIDETFCQELSSPSASMAKPPTDCITAPKVDGDEDTIEQRRKRIKSKAFKAPAKTHFV